MGLAPHLQIISSKSVHNLLRYAAKCQFTPYQLMVKSWKMIQDPRKNPQNSTWPGLVTCTIDLQSLVMIRPVVLVYFADIHTYIHTYIQTDRQTHPYRAASSPTHSGDYVGGVKTKTTGFVSVSRWIIQQIACMHMAVKSNCLQYCGQTRRIDRQFSYCVLNSTITLSPLACGPPRFP